MSNRDAIKQDVTESPVDFVIVTPLEEERDAVINKLPGCQKLTPTEDDIRIYFSSSLPVTFPGGTPGTYHIIVMPLVGMGRVEATAATNDAIHRWNPRYVILVGIAGGVTARDIKLGDLLISDQVVDYELQKLTPKGPEVRWKVYPADPRLVGAAHNLMDGEWQALITAKRPEAGASKRHIGPIASGDKVIAFSEVLAKYRKMWSKLIGVEMEAGGVALSALQAASQPKFFMVRGVSDLADENKGSDNAEKWRSYACDVAASYLIALLKSGPIPPSFPTPNKISKKPQSTDLVAELTDLGQVLDHLEQGQETSSAQHAEIREDSLRLETKIDKLLNKVSDSKEPETKRERLKTPKSEASDDIEVVPIARNLVPYLRIIEHQEEDLSQYKGVSETRIKRRIDKAVDLINGYKLRQAQALLETLRDEELPDIPNLDDIDPGLRASIYRLLGICHLRLRDFAAAFANFEIVKSIEGETEKLRKALLEYYTNKGDYDLAIQIAHEMLIENPTSIEAQNTFAIAALDKSRFEEIVKLYDGEPQADNDATAQAILSIAYLTLGNPSLALEKAQRLMKLEPQAPRAYEIVGNVHLRIAYARLRRQMEMPAEWIEEIVDKRSLHIAIENYQKALKLYDDLGQFPLSEVLRLNLANALASSGRLDEALQLIEATLNNISQPRIELFMLKAELEDEKGKTDAAIETCMQALRSFPIDCRIMTMIGGLYLNEREPEQAREWLDKAEANCNDPRDLSLIKIIRFKTFLYQNDRAASWACLHGIPVAEEEKARSLLAFGDYFYYFKNYSEAEQYYQQALSTAPDDLSLLITVVNFYRKLQQPEKALAYAEKLALLFATPTAYANYAQLLLDYNKPLEALAVLEQGNQKGLDSPILKYPEALCRQSIGQFSDASRLYEEYLKDSPDNFVATFNLGLCYHRQGHHEKAIRTLNLAKDLRPDNAQIHIALAQIYQIQEDREKAYLHAHQALDLEPNNPDLYIFFFQVAHACGREEEAAKALMEVPKRFPEYQHLKLISIEEAKELFISSRERSNQIKDFYRSSKFPLAILAKWLNKPLPLIWQVFCKDPNLRMLCAVGNFEEQRNSHDIAWQSSQVVVDYSAMVVLHHLGLLSLPLELFDSVYIAQGVFTQIQEDILYLVSFITPHRMQRLQTISDFIYQEQKVSRQTEWMDSSLMLDVQQEKDIGRANEQDILLAKQHSALYLLDNPLAFSSVEQILPNQVTTTKELLDYLYQRGKLKQIDYDKAYNYLTRTHNLHSFGIDKISNFKTIVVDYLTLDILFETEIVSLLVNEFDVIYISLPTLFLLKQDMEELKFHQDLLKIVKEIEIAITSNAGYRVQSSSMPEKINKYPKNGAIDESFLETFALAEELKLPIWTDDLPSRKFTGTNDAEVIPTFDTRTALDIAISREKLQSDKAYSSILALLRWNYHFVPIDSSMLFWSAKQYNFFPNADTDLLLSSLDESVLNAYEGLQKLKTNSVENIELGQLQDQIELLRNNLQVYADFLLRLWFHLPSENLKVRLKWAQAIFDRALKAVNNSTFYLSLLIIICIVKMLPAFDDEALHQFLVFCIGPFRWSATHVAIVDEAILSVLFKALYREGSYNDQGLRMAAKLLNSLPFGQYKRVMPQFRSLVAPEFLSGVQAQRNLRRPVEKE